VESEADIHQALYWPQYVKKNCKKCKLGLSRVAKGYLPWRERAMRNYIVCIENFLALGSVATTYQRRAYENCRITTVDLTQLGGVRS